MTDHAVVSPITRELHCKVHLIRNAGALTVTMLGKLSALIAQAMRRSLYHAFGRRDKLAEALAEVTELRAKLSQQSSNSDN